MSRNREREKREREKREGGMKEPKRSEGIYYEKEYMEV